MKIGDLSSLNLEEEDIVTLLVNLLDNAIEACDRLKDNKIIQFKMILEEGQLILSVRNPVEEAVEIKDKTVLTTKKNRERHGVGLHNINSVIENTMEPARYNAETDGSLFRRCCRLFLQSDRRFVSWLLFLLKSRNIMMAAE